MNKPTCEEGDRIKLIIMPGDPAPVPPGSLGTVMWTTKLPWGDQWQIVVKWDIPRGITLIWPTDQFVVIGKTGKTLEEITGVGNGNAPSGNTDKA